MRVGNTKGKEGGKTEREGKRELLSRNCLKAYAAATIRKVSESAAISSSNSAPFVIADHRFELIVQRDPERCSL